ncbi:MAG: RNA-binding protein [Prolixibacteraceae bacterium]|nr:RNA-binding protein [Prolixibacteraceae bacterium]
MDIFVAKLNADTTADQLKELFAQYGSVLSAKLIMDRETGMSKCYGFVEMEDDSEGSNAIEQLNDTNFMGNFIVVKRSEPKATERRSFDRRPGGGGGGGGNRRFEGNRRFDRNDRNFNRDRDQDRGGDRRRYNRDDRGGDYNRY